MQRRSTGKIQGTRPKLASGWGQILQSGPVSGSYAAYFPEFGNRELSADEQGTLRCETAKADRESREVSLSPDLDE